MKNHFFLKFAVMVVSAIFCVIYLNSCSKITEYREAKKREKQQMQEQKAKESQKMRDEMNKMLYRKEATLLAIKYKIDEDKVFNLLLETQGTNSENTQALIEGKSLSLFEGESITRSRLISLSEKYSIPMDILASMLIDYYSMQPCSNSGD